VCRPDCNVAAKSCIATDGSENIRFSATADAGNHDEQQGAFDRGDSKRAGVRRALTICRTAL